MSAGIGRMKTEQTKRMDANVDSRLFNDIKSVQILFHKMLFHRLKPSGLTAGQPKILEFLAARGEAVQREIASASDIGAPTAARILSNMEASGLIQRAHREGNRRSIVVELTSKGQEQSRLVRETFARCESIAIRGLEDRERILSLLGKVEENLRTPDGEDVEEERSSEDTKKFPFQKSLHYRLMICQTLLRKRLYEELADTKLTTGQPKVLEFLAGREGCQQKEIAQACLIEPATVTSLLLHMEQAGLVVRREENGNRRSLFVYLTDEGRAMAARSKEGVQRVINGAFAGIEDRQEEAAADLRQMYENLKERAER